MFHHHRSSVSQSRVEINQHHHQEEESMVVASSSAAHHHHHHHMGFNINPSLPLLTSHSSSLIPNCFGAHQLDSILGSGSDQAAAAASSSSPPNLQHASDDHVQLPASSSSAQISTSVNPWAWSTAEEGALLLSKKKELGESNNVNPDPKNKKKKKTSDSNSDNTGARRNMMVVVMMKKKKVMNKAGTRKKVREPRFCFKTMSEVDVLDDGYKWRKYGQKVVKNTQHPRSYYRCTQSNCRVKKRIERLAEDPRMVITTYEGRHVHSPSHDQDQSQSSSKFNLFW